MNATDILVVGAGPAGLAAAWRLAERGISVRLVEASDHVGGMAASFDVAGIPVDYGSHRLHPATPAPMLDALRGLLGDDLQERRRNGRLFVGGRWIGFPYGVGDLAFGLPPRVLAQLGRDLLTGPLRRGGGDTYADVVTDRFGPTLLEEIYRPYAYKLWGQAPEDLDAELARRRIAATGPMALARRLSPRRSTRGRMFFTTPRGYGAIPEAMADAAVAAGARIDLRTPVLSIDPTTGVVQTGGGEIEASVVMWTAPLMRLIAKAPAVVRDSADALRTRGVVLAYLVLERPRYSAFDAHYVPDVSVPFARLSEPKNYRNGNDPWDRTVLCAEIPCDPSESDAIWSASDADLAGLVVDGLARLGLPAAGPSAVVVRRLPSVYPVYRRGLSSARSTVQEWLDGLVRVVPVGRQATWVPDNLHHVLAMGWDVADCVRDDLTFDRMAWRVARTRHARHVVED